MLKEVIMKAHGGGRGGFECKRVFVNTLKPSRRNRKQMCIPPLVLLTKRFTLLKRTIDYCDCEPYLSGQHPLVLCLPALI